MTNNTNSLRLTIGLSALLVALALLVSAVLPLAAARLGWTTGYGPGAMQSMMSSVPYTGMMSQGIGPGMMNRGAGGGMMNGATSGYMTGFGWPFFGLGGLAMIFWPLALVGLAVVGLVWLVRARPAATCSQCGQPLQTGWKVCPNCGQKL